MSVLGVDVSKTTFDCCLKHAGVRAEATFDNNAAGFRKIVRWLRQNRVLDAHVCMEATGPYWRALAEALHRASIKVSVVNPGRTSLFARSQLRRTKTDRVDARVLADFCETQKPGQYQPPAPEMLALRAFLTYRKQLVREKVALQQVLSQVAASAALQKIHATQHKALSKAILAVEREIATLVKANHELQRQVQCVSQLLDLEASAPQQSCRNYL